MFSANWFFYLEKKLRDMGLDSDNQSFDEILDILQNKKICSPDEFASHCVYVILAGGFSQQTAKKIHKKIMDVLFCPPRPLRGHPSPGAQNAPPSEGNWTSSPPGEEYPAGGRWVQKKSDINCALPQNKSLLSFAKSLRKSGSLPEALLWNEIKSKQINGFDFDRQKVVGNYIVDFYCAELALVIEIDDKSHDLKDMYDENREKYLSSLGLRVIHVSAQDVLKNPISVAEMLKMHLRSENRNLFDVLIKIFNNKNKINAVCKIWNNRVALCDGYYQLQDLDDKLKYLQSLPHIGKITANHLARNLGEDVVKYDIWIQRLGCAYSGRDDLLSKINNGKLCDEIKSACDDMFVHLVKQTGLPRGYIDVVLWKSLQQGLIKL